MPRVLERIEYKGLKFDCRPGTSDEKAVKEVVVRRGYARRDFYPREGQKWLDLGANIGAFSIWAAAAGAIVEAYEPDPEHCEMIEHNLRLNGITPGSGRVHLHQKAVVQDGRKTATLHCNVARGNTWRNSIERDWRGSTSIKVPCINIEKIWKSGRFAKVDIEGSEMAIVEGIGSRVRLKGLVLEWSFDVDPSLVRFRAAMDGLREVYSDVRNAKSPEGDVWLPEWQPPCRTIWCLP